MTRFAKRALRVAVAQFDPHVGAIDANFEAIQAIIRTEANAGADLVVFPECALPGYPLQDLTLQPDFLARQALYLNWLAESVVQIGGPAVIVGATLPGSQLAVNAAAFLSPEGRRVFVHKHDLPNSDVFDEVRTFEPGKPGAPILWRGWRLGVMICEEMWHPEVAAHLAGQLADAFIVVNGSPFEVGKAEGDRMRHAQARARSHGIPLLYTNMVGAQDEIVFDGCSFAVNAEGSVTLRLPAFAEVVARTLLAANDDGKAGFVTCDDAWEAAPVSARRWLDGPAAMWRAAVLATTAYVEKNGFSHVLLGLSGGVDSAAVAAIAADGIGAERVHAVMLPSAVTLKEGVSVTLVEEQARRLGCVYESIDIRPIADAFFTVLGGRFAKARPEAVALARQNLQSRIRGVILMALSNLYGGLLLSTGNKSENSVGYATIYGDMCGGYNPIKDFYKTELYEAIAWRNSLTAEEAEEMGLLAGVEPVDPRIAERPPTAELEEGQTDEQALGDYDVLDALLRAMVEGMMSARPAAQAARAATGKPVSDLHAQRIRNLLHRAEWKRRQAPMGPKMGARNFGLGRRMPVTAAKEAFVDAA